MMSDVLAYVKRSGRAADRPEHPQVVRTADMMDMICIVFVRGKCPDDMLLALAEERGIAVMATDKRCSPRAACFTARACGEV